MKKVIKDNQKHKKMNKKQLEKGAFILTQDNIVFLQLEELPPGSGFDAVEGCLGFYYSNHTTSAENGNIFYGINKWFKMLDPSNRTREKFFVQLHLLVEWEVYGERIFDFADKIFLEKWRENRTI